FDPRLAASRALANPTRIISDVLLDQHIAAGIGNIWKCESLFASGIDPRTPVHNLTLEEIASVYSSARELMLANLAPRSAVPTSYRVYRRTHQTCACGAFVNRYLLGDPPRWTWSCPKCQRRPQLGVSGSRSRRG